MAVFHAPHGSEICARIDVCVGVVGIEFDGLKNSPEPGNQKSHGLYDPSARDLLPVGDPPRSPRAVLLGLWDLSLGAKTPRNLLIL